MAYSLRKDRILLLSWDVWKILQKSDSIHSKIYLMTVRAVISVETTQIKHNNFIMKYFLEKLSEDNEYQIVPEFWNDLQENKYGEFRIVSFEHYIDNGKLLERLCDTASYLDDSLITWNYPKIEKIVVSMKTGEVIILN